MNSSNPIILLVDDEPAHTRGLIRGLDSFEDGLSFLEATEVTEAVEQAKKSRPSVAVIDLSLDSAIGPDSGLSLIPLLLDNDPSIRILVLTGHNTDEYGIYALQAGAASFLSKPVDIHHLRALVLDAINYSELQRKNRPEPIARQAIISSLGIQSVAPVMNKVLETAALAATTKQPLLITGETGTGKGVLAHAIHMASHRRSFLRYQPSFGSADLVSSELFGHKRGSFTGATTDRRGIVEEANGGTLFIDEIGELPTEVQVLLLHVLQEKQFRRTGDNLDRESDFRLISATNILKKDLSNKLRSDFYHRIAHLSIELPPLRARLDDLPQLANFFLERLVNKEKLSVQRLSQEALSALKEHTWPGNIRELQSVMEGATYRAQFYGRTVVQAEDLNLEQTPDERSSSHGPFREQVRHFEIQLIRDSLNRHSGNQSKAAEELQLDRSTMRRIIDRARKERLWEEEN